MSRDKLIQTMVHSVIWEALAGFLDEGVPAYVLLEGRAVEEALRLVDTDDDLVGEVYKTVRSRMYRHLHLANSLTDDLNKEAGA